MKQKEKNERTMFAHLTTCIRTQVDNERNGNMIERGQYQFQIQNLLNYKFFMRSLLQLFFSKQVLVLFSKTIVRFQDVVSCCIKM